MSTEPNTTESTDVEKTSAYRLTCEECEVERTKPATEQWVAGLVDGHNERQHDGEDVAEYEEVDR